MSNGALLAELTPEVSRLLERHLTSTKEWFPHELVPWSRGRDFDPGEQWEPSESAVPPAVNSALFVNLLTEDNLPYYFHSLDHMFGGDGVWGEWARRWTAEEGRHSIVIRDYLTVTRSVDPVALERARMHQVSGGVVPDPPTAAEGLVYVAMQELATRIAHRNTGKLLDDQVGYDIMARVASDENLHYLFYRDLVQAALEIDPSALVIAIERQVHSFTMPGIGIVDFADHAAAIAKAGIYDLRIHHDQILVPLVLRHWDVAGLDGLSPEAEAARAALIDRIDRTDRAARRLAERRERATVSISG